MIVWGCISFQGVGELVVIDGNLNHQGFIEISLEQNLLQSVENVFGDGNRPFTFQQDNAPVHRITARNNQVWFDANDFQVIQWYTQLPDLNPIDNICGKMHRLLTKSNQQININGWHVCFVVGVPWLCNQILIFC